MGGLKICGQSGRIRIPQEASKAAKPGGKGTKEKLQEKSFENVLAEAMERQKRIMEDHSRMAKKCISGIGEYYGKGAFE